eukprot:1179969-Prorocentrum_minimum.AAC.1
MAMRSKKCAETGEACDFRICGTLDKSRKGVCSKELDAITKGLQWGEWSSVSKNGVQIAVWADHNTFSTISNAFPINWTGWVARTHPKDKHLQVRQEVPYPVQAYTQYAGGVDTGNQRIKLNNTYKGTRIKRFPTKICDFACNINSSNGHLQYQTGSCHRQNPGTAPPHQAVVTKPKPKPADHSPKDKYYSKSAYMAAVAKGLMQKAACVVQRKRKLYGRQARGEASDEDNEDATAIQQGGPTRRARNAMAQASIRSAQLQQGYRASTVDLSGCRIGEHRLIFDFSLRGGRDCSVCARKCIDELPSGGGVKKLRRQVKLKCVGCKGGKSGKYMCASCFFKHPKHKELRHMSRVAALELSSTRTPTRSTPPASSHVPQQSASTVQGPPSTSTGGSNPSSQQMASVGAGNTVAAQAQGTHGRMTRATSGRSATLSLSTPSSTASPLTRVQLPNSPVPFRGFGGTTTSTAIGPADTTTPTPSTAAQTRTQAPPQRPPPPPPPGAPGLQVERDEHGVLIRVGEHKASRHPSGARGGRNCYTCKQRGFRSQTSFWCQACHGTSAGKGKKIGAFMHPDPRCFAYHPLHRRLLEHCGYQVSPNGELSLVD